MGAGLALLGLSLGLGCKERDAGVDSVVDSSPVDTEWVDTGRERSLEAIALYPAELSVGVGAELELRAVGTYSDGSQALLELELAHKGDAVSTQGLSLTALSAGSAQLSVAVEGIEAQASITVQDSHELRVQVFADGAPLPKARVYFEGVKHTCDDDGRVSLSTADGGPVSLTAFSAEEAWIPVTLGGVLTRDLRVELTHINTLEPQAGLTPSISYEALDKANPDQLRLSLSGTALQASPVMVREQELLGANREVEIFGTTASLPQNLGIEDHAPQVALVAEQDPTQVWTLAGTLDIAQLSAGVDSFAQAAELLAAWEPTLLVGLSEPVGAEESPMLEPSALPSEEVWVSLPQATESSLVFVFERGSAGWLLQGLASGAELLRVPVPPGDGERWVVVWKEEGGAGSGAPRAMVSAPVSSGEATVSAWIDPLSHGGLQAVDGSYALNSDPSALYVHGFVQTKNGGVRELYLPAGAWRGALDGEPALSLGKTEWTLWSPHGWSGHYQSMLTSGGWAAAEEQAWAAGGLHAEIIGG